MANLQTAATAGSTAYPAWGLTWSFDRYGNRTQPSISSGCVAPMTCPTSSITIDPTSNRITGSPFAFDLAGNMTNDGVNMIVYDGENRLTSSTASGGSGTYTFDGTGLRVSKTSSGAATIYLFSGSKVIAEYTSGAAPTSPTKEYIYSGSQLLATITGSTTNYHIGDHLSPRVTTDSSGTLIGQQGHFPFGESWYAQSTTTKFQFTTYERDSESGNDYALARFNLSRLGRFSSPDPLSGSPSNPQTLNRYTYAVDDTIGLIDPMGRWPIPGGANAAAKLNSFGLGGGDFLLPAGGNCTIDGFDSDCATASALLQADTAFPDFGPNWKYKGDTAYGTNCYANTIADAAFCLGDIGSFGLGPTNLFNALSSLFNGSSDCSSLLGGADNADRILSQWQGLNRNINLQANASPETVANLNSGKWLAGSSFQVAGKNGPWAGTSISTSYGDALTNLSPEQIMAVSVHELMHPATAGTPTAIAIDFGMPNYGNLSHVWILGKCGLDLRPH
jgi:RHS repeat-associated protein